MLYQVWTKDEFEGWKRKDCEDLATVQQEIYFALKRGAEPLLTVEIPFDVNIKIKEDKISEVPKAQAKPDKSTGGESKGKVRPGAPGPVSELDQGSRDNRADNSMPGR